MPLMAPSTSFLSSTFSTYFCLISSIISGTRRRYSASLSFDTLCLNRIPVPTANPRTAMTLRKRTDFIHVFFIFGYYLLVGLNVRKPHFEDRGGAGWQISHSVLRKCCSN